MVTQLAALNEPPLCLPLSFPCMRFYFVHFFFFLFISLISCDNNVAQNLRFTLITKGYSNPSLHRFSLSWIFFFFYLLSFSQQMNYISFFYIRRYFFYGWQRFAYVSCISPPSKPISIEWIVKSKIDFCPLPRGSARCTRESMLLSALSGVYPVRNRRVIGERRGRVRGGTEMFSTDEGLMECWWSYAKIGFVHGIFCKRWLSVCLYYFCGIRALVFFDYMEMKN